MVCPLLKDTKDLLKKCVPNNIQIYKELDENMDIGFIEYMVKNNVLDHEYIIKMHSYIIDFLEKFQCKNDDISTKNLYSKTLKLLNDYNYPIFFTTFFKEVFVKLENIIVEADKFRKLIKNNN